MTAGLYNIGWGLYSALDPQWLFRFAGMPPQRYPEVFACLAMLVPAVAHAADRDELRERHDRRHNPERVEFSFDDFDETPEWLVRAFEEGEIFPPEDPDDETGGS